MGSQRMINLTKWIMVWSACFSMLMSPVTYASSQAQKATPEKMQQVLNQLGLNKQMTVGEFYAKNKHLYPERIRKVIEPLFKLNKNMPMPVYEVVSSQTTSGEVIPTIRTTSKNGEVINMQWYGEEEKLLKFQNTNLSEIDVINFDDMFTRITAGDEHFRKQIQPEESAKKVEVPKNFKYPNVTKGEWKTMTPYQRANYIVNLRLLWQDARKVLQEKNKKGKKTSEYNFLEKNKHFFALFFGYDANAAGKAKTVTGDKSASYFTGQTCIVAGYVAKYEKTSRGEICNHQVADQAYANRDNSLYLKAKEHCAQTSQIACNPYVFGTPNGSPTCITPSSDASFQKATHWDGPCDSASRLSTTEVDILKDKTKTNGRYEDGNLLSEEERAALLKTDQGKENYKLTENYLLGILKFRGVVKSDKTSLFDSEVLTDEVLSQILLDKKAFDNEIAEATKACKAESAASKSSPRVHEKNYWQACDQLNRRALFITEVFSAKCGNNKLNPDTLKCQCPLPTTPPPAAGTKPDEIIPGAQCKPPAIPARPVSQDATPASQEATPASQDRTRPASQDTSRAQEDCEARYPGATGLNQQCMCPGGKAPTRSVTDGASGQESWQCGPTAPTRAGKKEDDCGILCTIWGGLKTIAPFALVVASAFAIYKMIPKKPEIKPPGDLCPNGSAPPCAQVCTAPFKRQPNGGCGCDGCPPGQVAQASNCNCITSGGGTGGTTYLCPDSVTRVTNLENCPTYNCWNGQRYQNPMNCPPAPPPTPSVPGNGGVRR